MIANMADVGAAILVSVGCTKMYVSHMLKSILKTEINHTKHLQHLGNISGPNGWGKYLTFQRADFWIKNQNDGR